MQGVVLDSRVKQCVGCDAVGLVAPGVSVFVCDSCVDRFGDMIEHADHMLDAQGKQVS